MPIRARLLLGFALVCLALVAAPLTMYMAQSSRSLQSVRLKHAGIGPSKALLRMVQLLQQHRGLSTAVLGGNTMMGTQRAAKQIETDKAVEAFDAVVRSDITDAAVIVAWGRTVDIWRRLANDVSSRAISDRDSFVNHTTLIGENLRLLDLMLDYFGLSYDPAGHDYHLTMALLVHMPNLTEFLGQMRARGSLYLTMKRITPADRIELIGLISTVERQHEYMTRELSKTVALNPRMKTTLGHIAQGSVALAQKAMDLARTHVVEAKTLSYSPVDYFSLFTQAIDGQFTLLDQAMVDLEEALRARVDELRGAQIMTIGFIACVIAVAVWLGTVIARTLKQDMAALQQSEEEQRVAAMQLSAKVEELERMQSRLIEAERLRAMGQMAAGVAHDFNNALMGVLGQAQLMRLSLEQGPVAASLQGVEGYAGLLECLARQERVVLDAAETIRKIRESTRQGNEEAFGPVALGEIVEQVLAISRPRWKDQAEAAGIPITVRTALTDTPPVLGHAAELREAITNLLFNALDAMPHGGTVTIATRHVTGDVVELTVTDTGVGMSQAVQAHLFEPFFTTKGTRGTGLGLSMVHGIVSRHRGEITVQSVEGQGTTITLRLPVAEVTAEVAALPAAPPPLAVPLRLLIIDDDPLLAETLGELLRTLGHEAAIATSGEEGLTRLAAERFDLVMTDLGMPGMSGWDVARVARARWPQLPVILVTGWGDVIEQDRIEGTGVDAVLAKPYTVSQLQYVLAIACRAHTAGREEPSIG